MFHVKHDKNGRGFQGRVIGRLRTFIGTMETVHGIADPIHEMA